MEALKVVDNQLSELEANPLYRALSCSQVMVELNLDGTIVMANANFLKAFSYLAEEIVGKKIAFFFEESFSTSD